MAIMPDLLDLHQAFAAGVHFLIHKPASAVQIERCLRAAYCATVVRRRKQHRETVSLPAVISTRTQPFAEARVVNLSEGGIGLQIDGHKDMGRVALSSGDEVGLRFALPESDEILHTMGRVVWTTAHLCGIRFSYIPDDERTVLEQWMTVCVDVAKVIVTY